VILISPTEWIPWLVQHGTKWIFILFFWSDACFLILNITSLPDTVYLKNGPEPLEKEIHEILGSKREDRFSNPFFELVHKMCQVHFSYLLRLGNFCKGPADTAKVPAEVPEDSRVLRARRLCMQPPILRVNHGLTQRASVTPLLVLCLAFFNKRSVTNRK